MTMFCCETAGGGTLGTIMFLLSVFLGVIYLFLSLLKEYCFMFVALGDHIRWRFATGDIGISLGVKEILFTGSVGFFFF